MTQGGSQHPQFTILKIVKPICIVTHILLSVRSVAEAETWNPFLAC